VRAVDGGEIATCRFVVLELLRSARNAGELASARTNLDELRDLPIRRREWDRAADVMQALAEQAPLHHRRVPLPDLVIAAAAESAEVRLLHYDRHFEVIAAVTGQPMRAIAPLGSL
jgi:predicted nucleic acid-binding protein